MNKKQHLLETEEFCFQCQILPSKHVLQKEKFIAYLDYWKTKNMD